MRYLIWGICLIFFTSALANPPEEEEKFLIRINYKTTAEAEKIKKLDLETVQAKEGAYVEVKLTWKQIFEMLAQGYDINFIIEHIESHLIDSVYHTLDEMAAELKAVQRQYPSICLMDEIGKSTTLGQPLQVVKISDNPQKAEDEPQILITGGHHAREPLSLEICLYLIHHFCQGYLKDPQIKKWIDDYEIWIVPLVNPDGYSVIFDPNKNLTWWRKNLRDNNRNGMFDPEIDGVDLNRNYDFNWEQGGSDECSSQYYRGASPFSENETRALKNLVEEKHFSLIIDYHSFGESILYPWGNYSPPPDIALIQDIAGKMAAQIKKLNSIEDYDLIPLDAQMGQSSVWHYGVHGILAYIVETGDSYFPEGNKINHVCKNNAQAIYYLLERMRRSRFTGHVYNFETKEPVVAEIRIRDSTGVQLKSIKSDICFGRFDRILNPGIYRITIKARHFQDTVLENVEVFADKPTEIEIFLEPEPHLRKLEGNE